MKKRHLLDRAAYESPAVTLLDICVEQGFAISFGASGGTTNDNYDVPSGSGSGPLAEEEWN